MRTLVSITLLTLMGAFGAANARADTVGFTVGTITGTDVGANDPVTLGMTFTANNSISVDGLGFYDQTTGVTGSETVGLYSCAQMACTSGTLLTSVVVNAPSTAINGYVFQSLTTPVALTSGGTYTVAVETGNNAWADGGNPGTNAAITFDHSDYIYGSTLTFPSGSYQAEYYGPNFEFEPTVTPEPTTGLLYGTGLLGMMGIAFLRRKKTNGFQT